MYLAISSCTDAAPAKCSRRAPSTSSFARPIAASALSNSPRSSGRPPRPMVSLSIETTLYRAIVRTEGRELILRHGGNADNRHCHRPPVKPSMKPLDDPQHDREIGSRDSTLDTTRI